MLKGSWNLWCECLQPSWLLFRISKRSGRVGSAHEAMQWICHVFVPCASLLDCDLNVPPQSFLDCHRGIKVAGTDWLWSAICWLQECPTFARQCLRPQSRLLESNDLRNLVACCHPPEEIVCAYPEHADVTLKLIEGTGHTLQNLHRHTKLVINLWCCLLPILSSSYLK